MYVCKLTKIIFQHYSIILELNNEIDSKILYKKKKKNYSLLLETVTLGNPVERVGCEWLVSQIRT